MKITKDIKRRFFEKVEIPNGKEGCWIWVGSIGGGRYGGFLFNGKVELAHRMAWMIRYGKISSGAYICHHCDNTKCVNSEHLFKGDQFANMADMMNKGRGRNGLLKGEQITTSKLTEQSVREIKELIKNKIPGVNIAKLYGVHKATISDIKVGKNWKHVTI